MMDNTENMLPCALQAILVEQRAISDDLDKLIALQENLIAELRNANSDIAVHLHRAASLNRPLHMTREQR